MNIFKMATNSLVLSGFVISTAACKSIPSGGNLAASHSDTREPDQSWTEARLITLGAYAKDLLNYTGNEQKTYNEQQLIIADRFKRAGIMNPEPLSQYSLELGAYGECFGDASGQRSIWWNSSRDQLRQQIDESAFFIRDYHIAMMGKNHGAFLFRNVIICPEEVIKTKMILKNDALYIGIPSSYGAYRPLKNSELLALWQAGYPIGLASSSGGFLKDMLGFFNNDGRRAQGASLLMWKIFNPLSPIRGEIRKALYDNHFMLAKRLDDLSRRFSTTPNSPSAAEGFRSEIANQFLSGSDPSVSKELLDPTTDSLFQSFNFDQLQKLVADWRCFSAQESNLSAIEDDSMAVIQDSIANEQNEITKDVQAGLVAVVNHHRIGVQVAVGVGGFKKFIKVPNGRSMKIQTKVRAGLVAVDTSDDITVNLDGLVNMNKTLPTAGFDTSVRSAKYGQNICAAAD